MADSLQDQWAVPGCCYADQVSAEALFEHDPDSPEEILRVLPEEYHDEFLQEYEWALVSALKNHRNYTQLRRKLRLWRLRADAYRDPRFMDEFERAMRALETGDLADFVPAEQVLGPDWAERARARRLARGK
jgi:Family of unknown function (DUF6247)